MIDRNTFLFGAGIGLLSPLVGGLLVAGVFMLMVSGGHMDAADMGLHSKRMRTIILIAICTNVLWIRHFNRAFKERTLRGVISATMLYSMIWFAFYFSALYAEE